MSMDSVKQGGIMATKKEATENEAVKGVTDVKPENVQGPSKPVSKATPFSDREAQGKNSQSVIAIRINADGNPDFAGMRPGTKEKLQAFLAHPSTVQEFHLAPAKVEAAAFDPIVVGTLFQAIGDIRAKLYEVKLELPEDMAQKIGRYSPEQQAVLIPLTQKVLAKHSSEFLAKWNDEISLAMVFVGFEMMKFRQVAEISRQLKEAKEITGKPNGKSIASSDGTQATIKQ
jgi:hypothetical protein